MPGAAAVEGAAAGAGFAAAFFAAGFFAAGFLAAGFFAAAFFGAAFLAAGFFAAAFFTAGFFAAGFFGAAFFTAGFFAAAFFGAAFFAAGFFAAAFFGAAFFAAGFAAVVFFAAAGFLAFFSSAIVNLHCMFEKGKINNPLTTARIIQQCRRTGIDEFKRFPRPSLDLGQDGGTRQTGIRQEWGAWERPLVCGGNADQDYGRGDIKSGHGFGSIDHHAPCVFLHALPFVGYCGKYCGSELPASTYYI